MFKLIKARQLHVCDNCKKYIQIGENYWRSRGEKKYTKTHEFPCI